MGISVKLQAFEGPLDLLLHLIDKNKVNIYDIPIADITSLRSRTQPIKSPSVTMGAAAPTR